MVEQKLEAFAIEVMAHEIGHHVYCPADLTDHGRCIARIRAGLPTKEHLAGFIANLYTDLLINDRLQRQAGLDIAGVYQALGKGSRDAMWAFYMRIYEILWRLPKKTLIAYEIATRKSPYRTPIDVSEFSPFFQDCLKTALAEEPQLRPRPSALWEPLQAELAS